jgi:hypothetical protein
MCMLRLVCVSLCPGVGSDLCVSFCVQVKAQTSVCPDVGSDCVCKCVSRCRLRLVCVSLCPDVGSDLCVSVCVQI